MGTLLIISSLTQSKRKQLKSVSKTSSKRYESSSFVQRFRSLLLRQRMINGKLGKLIWVTQVNSNRTVATQNYTWFWRRNRQRITIISTPPRWQIPKWCFPPVKTSNLLKMRTTQAIFPLLFVETFIKARICYFCLYRRWLVPSNNHLRSSKWREEGSIVRYFLLWSLAR